MFDKYVQSCTQFVLIGADERKTIKCFNNVKQQSLFSRVGEGVNDGRVFRVPPSPEGEVTYNVVETIIHITIKILVRFS